MAMTKCKECGADISTKAEACPKCGARQPRPTSGCAWLVAIFVALPLLIFWLRSVDRVSNAAPRRSSVSGKGVGPNDIDAQLMCTKAIKAATKNPSAAVIPHSANQAQSSGFYFVWNRGDGLRLQNDFGALNDAEVTCAVQGDPMRITLLKIDGQRLIDNPPSKKL